MRYVYPLIFVKVMGVERGCPAIDKIQEPRPDSQEAVINSGHMRQYMNFQGGLLKKQLVPFASVVSATIINNLVGFAVNVFAARLLGVELFGVFSLAFAVATMTGAIGEFGLNLTMIRLFNKYKDESKSQTSILGSVLGFKGLVFVLLALISIPLGGFWPVL